MESQSEVEKRQLMAIRRDPKVKWISSGLMGHFPKDGIDMNEYLRIPFGSPVHFLAHVDSWGGIT